jgi:hypothetical protein
MPRPAFRELLASVWEHDHRWLMASVIQRRQLRSMFRYAEFSIPNALPSRVRIWRGTSGISRALAKRGISWSLDRAVACWFATRWSGARGVPLVLHAVVPRESLHLYYDGRDEREVVVFDVMQASPDGDPRAWHALGRRADERRQAEIRARLDTARQKWI